MSEIDPEIIKNTKESLEKYIKKPPLTEKLLSRPPFRFLHDIVTSVINGTGFMKGLFTELEMNSENVKEKEAKISFLKKLIGIVSLVLSSPINVNPSSIVAGKESEKTNVLLQSLAIAISKKVDNDIYVKKTLAGEANKLTISKVTSTPSDNKSSGKSRIEVEKSKHNEKSSSKHHGSSQNTENVSNESKKLNEVRKSKEKSVIEEKPKDKHIVEEKSKEKHNAEDKIIKKPKKERIENESIFEKEKKEEVKSTKHKTEKRVVQQVSDNVDNVEKALVTEAIVETKSVESTSIVDYDLELSKRLARPSSAKGTRHRHENDHPVLSEDKENEKKKLIVRPPSARPAPPKVRKSSEVGLDDTINNQTKVSGLIIDADRESDGDYVVEEYVGGGEIDVKFSHTIVDNALDANEKHGALVQSIIQSKKEFSNNEKVDIVNHSDIQRKRERLSTEKEIEKIRVNLQAVTKSVNPLGKLIDFIQEDLDTMQKESEKWHSENDELEKVLQSEKNVTNKMLKPIKEKLEEQNKINMEQEEAISKLRANIEKNSRKIEAMLLNSCSSRA